MYGIVNYYLRFLGLQVRYCVGAEAQRVYLE